MRIATPSGQSVAFCTPQATEEGLKRGSRVAAAGITTIVAHRHSTAEKIQG